VEISPNAEPPVCRLIDYSKFIYQQKKRQKEMKAKQVKIDVKEIRFGPQTDDHDYNFKLKHAMGFLADGDKSLMSRIRTSPPAELASFAERLRDPRMPELLFRYRARNHLDTLDTTERSRWNDYRRQRLLGDASLGEQTLPQFTAQLDALVAEHADDAGKLALLQQLRDWGIHLQSSL
ncbi:MAG: translation initiation factor IF-3, partial [Stenotrophomonas maltophilia]